MKKDDLLRVVSDDNKFKDIIERVVKYYALGADEEWAIP